MQVNDYDHIEHLIPSLRRYADFHIPTGSFLEACLSNDLMGAVGRADFQNIELLPIIACYIYNDMPSPCHGSPAHYDAWVSPQEVAG